MLTRSRLTVIIAFVLSLFLTSLAGAVPNKINYQGKVTGTGNIPLEGTYDIKFHIYNDPTDGNELWNEQQIVPITDGVFNVSLGAVVPLSEAIFAANFLGLEVEIYNPDSAAWEMLSPRQHLISVAYAMRAEVAVAVADGAINTVHIMNSAVTGDKIANGTVAASDLKDGAVLAEIIDNDGSGSGLDADNLDGNDASYFSTAATVTSLQNRVTTLEVQVNNLLVLLAGITRSGDDISFSGVNVHIVDGSGSTDGITNGRGNLIVGYNETRDSDNARTGSHNIVVGVKQNFTSYGGLVAGFNNTISGFYANVTGGSYNIASNGATNVSGGSNNTASGLLSSVSGGRSNKASGEYSFVGGGGHSNLAYGNQAFSNYSAILGGVANIAGDNTDPNNHGVGEMATISGGDANRAREYASSISGGKENYTYGPISSVSGGNLNTAYSAFSSISGGQSNITAGDYSSISGGRSNKASGDWSFIGGGGHSNPAYGNLAFSHYSAILGGSENETGNSLTNPIDHDLGTQATISGGRHNYATGDHSTIGGGSWVSNSFLESWSANNCTCFE